MIGTLEVNNLSIINWEIGEILNGEIELIYYLNDAYHSTLKINKVEIIIPSNVLEAEGLLPKKEFNITAEVVNGIINNEGTVTYNKDETVTYHFKPKEGYKIKSILIDGVEQEVLGDSYTFEKLDKNYTIKVIYEKIEETNIPVTGLRKVSTIMIGILITGSYIAYKITKRKYI